jgi:hypothetical protein
MPCAEAERKNKPRYTPEKERALSAAQQVTLRTAEVRDVSAHLEVV